MSEDDLRRLRRLLELAPDDLSVAMRLAQTLARRGELEEAARLHMWLFDRAPDLALPPLSGFLAHESVKPADAAWLATMFAGSRLKVLDRAVALANAFAVAATAERARAVTSELRAFGQDSKSLLLGFARVEALRPHVVDLLRHWSGWRVNHYRFTSDLIALLDEG